MKCASASLLLLVAVLSSGCGAQVLPRRIPLDEAKDQIIPGKTTHEEVWNLLGAPDKLLKNPPGEIWEYRVRVDEDSYCCTCIIRINASEETKKRPRLVVRYTPARVVDSVEAMDVESP